LEIGLWIYLRRNLTIIAVYRDEEKLHTYRGPGASKSSIDIYSCAGKLIRSINVWYLYIVLAHTRLLTGYSGTRALSRAWGGLKTRNCW
jgi:hypothetical protein